MIVVSTIHEWAQTLENIEDCGQTDIAALEFSKAFDRVSHERLTLTSRRLRPIPRSEQMQTRDPLNFGPCKADWPAAFVIK